MMPADCHPEQTRRQGRETGTGHAEGQSEPSAQRHAHQCGIKLHLQNRAAGAIAAQGGAEHIGDQIGDIGRGQELQCQGELGITFVRAIEKLKQLSRPDHHDHEKGRHQRAAGQGAARHQFDQAAKVETVFLTGDLGHQDTLQPEHHWAGEA